ERNHAMFHVPLAGRPRRLPVHAEAQTETERSSASTCTRRAPPSTAVSNWSGSPFTADDFVFWYEDMYQNKDLIKSPAPEFSAKGKPGRLVKVDETTVAFEFDEPHFLFPSQLAGDTQVGGGQSRLQSDERELGLY